MITALIIYSVVITILGALLFTHLITSIKDEEVSLMPQPRYVRIVVTCLWPVVMLVWFWQETPRTVKEWGFVVVSFIGLVVYAWLDLVEWLG